MTMFDKEFICDHFKEIDSIFKAYGVKKVQVYFSPDFHVSFYFQFAADHEIKSDLIAIQDNLAKLFQTYSLSGPEPFLILERIAGQNTPLPDGIVTWEKLSEIHKDNGKARDLGSELKETKTRAETHHAIKDMHSAVDQFTFFRSLLLLENMPPRAITPVVKPVPKTSDPSPTLQISPP